MKRFFLFNLIMAYFSVFINAQDVRISAIPYIMQFENEVLDYSIVDGNHFKIVAPAKTDLYITSDGGYEVNKSPRLLFKPDSNFTLISKIKLEFNSKWDAGVLLIYNDSKHYAKLCFEQDFTGKQRVVTVVCNETSDDCNSMIINDNEIYFRIAGSTKEKSFAFAYSEDGIKWFPVRGFKLDKIDNVRIGFSAQSPTGKKCSVDFSEIYFRDEKPKDILW